jgi:hypothetical protein
MGVKFTKTHHFLRKKKEKEKIAKVQELIRI